jgi:predicted nucleotidyltransferase
VLRVLVEHGGSLGVSDISRRARLTMPSTRAALRRLLDAELIVGIGAGRSIVCALNPAHPLAAALAALFNAEREQAGAVFNSIRDAARRLRPTPLAVWLYGSVSRGEDVLSSDIDIALVSSEKNPTHQADALREAIAAAAPGRELRIAVIALALGDVRRLAKGRAKIWLDIKRDAAVLYGLDPAAVLEKVSARRTRA